MSDTKSPVEMYNELIQLGLIVPAAIAPTGYMTPSAYISVPSTLAFSTPPIEAPKADTNAKLESRPKGNSGRKRRRK